MTLLRARYGLGRDGIGAGHGQCRATKCKISAIEAIDANSIEKRFNQQGLEMYLKLEQLVFKASSRQSTHDISSAACSFYSQLNAFELET